MDYASRLPRIGITSPLHLLAFTEPALVHWNAYQLNPDTFSAIMLDPSSTLKAWDLLCVGGCFVCDILQQLLINFLYFLPRDATT